MLPENTSVALRPHHGMCLAYFEGKGYSEGFTVHMQAVSDRLIDESETCVVLTLHCDEICAACPENDSGSCSCDARVLRFDREVLRRCDLQEGQRLPFHAFSALVQERILGTNQRAEICGDCRWNEICANRPSAWA